MKIASVIAVTFLCALPGASAQTGTRSWASDNGNGTYSNPLFYDEFSDPDMIRVGADYYLTGTTMHAMPGLPILHSRDLVNWRVIGYAFERLDLGPDFRLEDGKQIYGQGIWPPASGITTALITSLPTSTVSGFRSSVQPIRAAHGSTTASSRVCTTCPSSLTRTEKSTLSTALAQSIWWS